MKRYIAEFLFFFVFVALFMYLGTAYFNTWHADNRLDHSVAFALGASITHVIMSVLKDRLNKKGS